MLVYMLIIATLHCHILWVTQFYSALLCLWNKSIIYNLYLLSSCISLNNNTTFPNSKYIPHYMRQCSVVRGVYRMSLENRERELEKGLKPVLLFYWKNQNPFRSLVSGNIIEIWDPANVLVPFWNNTILFCALVLCLRTCTSSEPFRRFSSSIDAT